MKFDYHNSSEAVKFIFIRMITTLGREVIQELPTTEHDVTITVDGYEVNPQKFLEAWESSWDHCLKQAVQDHISQTCSDFQSRLGDLLETFAGKMQLDINQVAEEYGWKDE